EIASPRGRGRDPHARYVVRSSTCRTVAAYHCAPPCAVGTPASLRLSAILGGESPRVRCRWIRRTTACGIVGGRPSRTPLAFLIALRRPSPRRVNFREDLVRRLGAGEQRDDVGAEDRGTVGVVGPVQRTDGESVPFDDR